MEIMIVAGEASGDAHAGELIQTLAGRYQELRFFGCGGAHMAAAGCELLVHDSELAVMGLAEVVRHLPRLRRLWRKLRAAMLERRPRAVILVDFPDFNLRLAAAAHRAGIPVIYFISPQIWAWRSGRAKQIQRYVERMICIFPFEADFYAQHGVAVAAVGHPLVERVARARAALPSEAEWRQRLGVGAETELIAVLPGSRPREADFHLPVLADAMGRLRAGRDCAFLLPVAPHIAVDAVRAALPASLLPAVHLLPPGDMYAALAYARLALVASGTATVETALFGVPMIVYYRLSDWTYRIGRRLVRTEHVAMVNLIAGRTVVPELIQSDFTGAAVAAWAERLLPEGPERAAMLAGLAGVRENLGPIGAIARAADEVADSLGLVLEQGQGPSTART